MASIVPRFEEAQSRFRNAIVHSWPQQSTSPARCATFVPAATCTRARYLNAAYLNA